MKRLPAIDVHRGVIVVLMVMHHTVDAWIRDGDRHGPLYVALRHLGGLPAPGFLFLAGLSSALVLARERKKGVPAKTRAWAGVRRGLYVLGIAFAFRVVAFVFGRNPLDAWPMIFRVDILNCMGVALGLVGGLTALARSWRGSALLSTLLGLAFLLPAPLVWGHTVTFPSDLAGNYVAGSGMLVMFPLFPWLFFAAIGFACGELLAKDLGPAFDAAAFRRYGRLVFGLGALAILAGWGLERLPFDLYPPHDYWKASPLFMLIRVGIQLALLGALVEVVTRAPAPFHARDPLQLVGRHSLAIYLIHVEAVYGQVSNGIRGELSIGMALAGMAVVNVLSYGLARCLEWWDHRPRRQPVPVPAPPPAA